jgi:hypothetical protein
MDLVIFRAGLAQVLMAQGPCTCVTSVKSIFSEPCHAIFSANTAMQDFKTQSMTQDSCMQFVSGNILSPCAIALAFSTVTLALRYRDTYLARRLTIPDRNSYDILWAAIIADSSARPGLIVLCARSADLCRHLPRNAPRQKILQKETLLSPLGHHSLSESGGSVSLFPWLKRIGASLAGETVRALPADYLDQLFIQARFY